MEILEAIKTIKKNTILNTFFGIRNGIHPGPLIAGVVHDKKICF